MKQGTGKQGNEPVSAWPKAPKAPAPESPVRIETLTHDDEALGFIDRHALMGRGIGYIDMHLLASAALAAPTRLWTRDKRLANVAVDLNLEFQPQAH